MWICPPFSQLDAVVEKIMADKAEGILLIPVWKNKHWFTELHRVTVMWWDLQQNAAVLQTPSGKPIPSRRDMSLRAVVFNATGADEYKNKAEEENMNKLRLDNGLPHTLMSVDWECPSHGDMVTLRGVIASAAQHTEAKKYVKGYFPCTMHSGTSQNWLDM